MIAIIKFYSSERATLWQTKMQQL